MKNNHRRNTDFVTQCASLFAISGVRCYMVKVVFHRSVARTHLWNRLNALKKGTYTNSVDPEETPQKHTLGNSRL